MINREVDSLYPSAKFGDKGYVHADREREVIQRNADWRLSEVQLGEWSISLEHQCDEWEIGTPEQAKQFVKDVQEAIAYCEANP